MTNLNKLYNVLYLYCAIIQENVRLRVRMTKTNLYKHSLLIQTKRSCLFVLAAFILVAAACSAQNKEQTPELTASSSPNLAVVPTASPAPVKTTEPKSTATPEPSPAPSFAEQVVCTADEFVNIRETADKNAAVLGTLPAGEVAGMIAYADEWANIIYDGITGYVNSEYLMAMHQPRISVPMGDWALMLVNPSHYLPKGFEVSVADFEGGQVDARILKICEAMFADAKEDGVDFQLVDAYRSYDRQNKLYQDKVDSYIAKGYSREDAESKAAAITARPNTSEHQTGLALDIVTPSYTKRDKGFAKTDAFKWLNVNAHHYGFTLRYKNDKVSYTKVIFEPWHWRFVGVQAAADMKQSGECLEEYLKLTD